MKTKEFIKKVQELGFQVRVRGKEIKICDDSCGYGVGEPMFVLVSDFVEVLVPGKVYISSLERISLLSFIVEYLDTPPSDREEEKRYRLRYVTPPLLRRKLTAPEYLYFRRCDGYVDTSLSGEDDPAFQTIFTETEISEMDITGFEKEPVE